MNKLYPLFLILSLLLILTTIYISGGTAAFFNLPSLLIVIILPLLTGLMSFSMGDLVNSFRVVFHPGTYDPPARRRALVILRAVTRNLDYTAILAFLLGITAMLVSIRDMDFLASGLALAMLVILYGLIIKFILLMPLIHSLEKTLAE